MGRATVEYLAKNNFIVYAFSRNIEKLADIKNKP